MSSRNKTLLFCIVIVFIGSRFLGLDLPYHQDEWKNVSVATNLESAGQFFTHPPFMALSFVLANEIVGENNFRLFPIFFSSLSLLLLFIVVKKRYGYTPALFSAFLYILCFYNFLGSIQTDVDGAIIPFLFLICVYFYDNFTFSIDRFNQLKWLFLLITTIVIGLLIKLSFIIIIGVLLFDYILNNRKNLDFRKTKIIFFVLVGTILLYILLLYLIEFLYPAFSISGMLGHANQYTVKNLGRNFTQIIVQALKAIFYLSPLLLVPLLFISKEIFKKTKLFLIYIFLGLVFYLVIFDFSRGALDKYLMFTIIPLLVIVAVIFDDIYKRFGLKNRLFDGRLKWWIISGLLISFVFIMLNYLPHNVLALYPKNEWFSSVAHFKWNILNPFTGGSGPAGFYVSFLFIAVSFVISFFFGIVGILKEKWKIGATVLLIFIGLTYNVVMAEELLFGKINGNVSKVIASSISYLSNNDQIEKVISYNDIGTADLVEIGKYGGRFYANPDNESSHKIRFANNDYYLIIDIPHLYDYSFYGEFFSKCKILYSTQSKRISGKVYDCGEVKGLIEKN